MKKTKRIKSLTTKSILIILISFIIFMLIAAPIIQAITFNVFNPYLIENAILKTGDSAVYMSMFLARSNPTMYKLTYRNENFCTAANKLAEGSINVDEFREAITESTTPFTTEFPMTDGVDYSGVSYPVIYSAEYGIFCDDSISEAASNLVDSEWFKHYQENRENLKAYSPIVYQNEDGKQEGYFSYVYTFHTDEDNQNKYYAIVMTKYSDIFPLWDSVLELGIDDFGFIGFGCEPLYQSIDGTQWNTSWILDNLASGRQHYVITLEENDKTHCAVLVSYENEQLRFYSSFSNDIFSNLFINSNWRIQLIFAVFIGVFVLIVIFIFNRIFKRLVALTDKIAVIQNGNYDVTFDDSSEDEIGQLASAFNTMTGKIQDNINELVEKEKREKMLQYNLTISAMDPHFIYNTLNTSTRLAELGRSKEVVIVNDALINCLKNNLKMKNFQSFDTVENEINTLMQYITIQNYLCDNTVSLECSITDNDKGLQIPKFLLQPLVENSILHGIVMNVDKDGNSIPGKIKIAIDTKGERITIKVKDNGIGMSQETIEKYFRSDESVILNETAHFEHIGVLNLRNRLSYLYSNNYSISVNSQSGKGTEIIIDIPKS
ncbi:MAG: HAMP domain-containing protein [Ruminococcaceae bacterium]|nr:HAMP domain-containing protein [Oscillospiraceae bacterium]